MQASGASAHELFSNSVEKLQALQPKSGSEEAKPEFDESAWLQDVIEHSGRGDSSAQFSLGQYYFAKGDFERALEYYSLAADNGNAQAIYQLAVMNYDGTGIPPDPVRVKPCVKAPGVLGSSFHAITGKGILFHA